MAAANMSHDLVVAIHGAVARHEHEVARATPMAALEEVDNARGLVFAGKMSDRIFDLASKGGIENVLASSVSGTARKGTVSAYAPSDL